MTYALKPHQIEGRDRLVRQARAGRDRIPHFLLADEQRVGKCAQGLTAAQALGAERVLVLCKAIGRDNWKEQHAIWTPGAFDLQVESYNRFTVNAGAQKTLAQYHPDILILDEAQMLRNATAQRTNLVYGGECDGSGLVRDVPVVWLMSGTIASNNVGELWTHLHALWEWDMDYFDFIDRYTHWSMGEYGPRFHRINRKTIHEVQRFLDRISLRRLFREVNPTAGDPVWNAISLTPATSLAAIRKIAADPHVQRTLQDLMHGVENERAAKRLEDTPMGSMIRLIGTAKAPLVAEYVRDMLDEGDRKHVIIGALHHDVMDILQHHLRKRRVLRIDGTTTQRERKERQRAWLAGEADVLIGHLEACGTSIDLSIADACVLAETSWQDDVNKQFVSRCLHLAKSDPLPVDVCALAGSSDEGVARVVARKGEQSAHLWREAA